VTIGRRIAKAIIDGTCIVINGRPYKYHDYSTAFWIIEGTDSTFKLQGSLDIPGHTSDQIPYHSELRELYVVVTMISAVCKHYGISNGFLEIACDRLSALKTLLLRSAMS